MNKNRILCLITLINFLITTLTDEVEKKEELSPNQYNSGATNSADSSISISTHN